MAKVFLKQRDEVLDNRAKHNELQVDAGTVATVQVTLADSVKEHTINCRMSLTTSPLRINADGTRVEERFTVRSKSAMYRPD